MPERQRLHELACAGLRALADLHFEQQLDDSAAHCLERLALLQPYDEGVHRQLIELEIRQGRQSDALRCYDGLRTRVNRAFGRDPSFSPAELVTGKR
jgi:DNA-binding SARP family transcriptional activator